MRNQFSRKLGRFMLCLGRNVYPLFTAVYILVFVPLLLTGCIAKLLFGVPLGQSVYDDDEEVKRAWNDKRWGKHGFIEANGIKFHYVESGPQHAPLMLFLHGFPECWYSWRGQLHAIGKTGKYHCVAIDLRGYGLTDKPQDTKTYCIENLVADVEGVIDAFAAKHSKREKKAVVVGHDWGGWLSWHAGHLIPHKLSALCIMNAPHPLLFERNSSIAQFFRFWYMYFFQVPYLSELILSALNFWGIGFAFTGFITGVRDLKYMTDTDVKVFKYAFSRPKGPSAVMRYFYNSIKKSPSDIAKTLSSPIPPDLPLVVLWGEYDGALGLELMDDLDVIVRPKLTPTFFKASHWLQHERPDEVNAHLLAFLAKHGVTGEDTLVDIPQVDVEDDEADKAQSELAAFGDVGTDPASESDSDDMYADSDSDDGFAPPSLSDMRPSKLFAPPSLNDIHPAKLFKLFRPSVSDAP